MKVYLCCITSGLSLKLVYLYAFLGGLPSAPSGVAVPSPPQGGAGYRGAGYNDAGYGGAGYGNTGYNGAVTQQPYSPPFDNTTLQFKPPNYLALNMFTAFCCCLICGIMGIFVGTQVNNSS